VSVENYLNAGNWRIIGEFSIAAGCPIARNWTRRLRQPDCTAFPWLSPRWSVAFLSRLLEAGVDVGFADLPAIEGPTGRRADGRRCRT
jgi:hypothetical protein